MYTQNIYYTRIQHDIPTRSYNIPRRFLLESMAKGSIFSYGTLKDFKHTTSKTSQLAKRDHKIVKML